MAKKKNPVVELVGVLAYLMIIYVYLIGIVLPLAMKVNDWFTSYLRYTKPQRVLDDLRKKTKSVLKELRKKTKSKEELKKTKATLEELLKKTETETE